MSQRRRAWILAGLGSGLAAGAAALALAKTRQQRRSLARRAPALTDQAISRLPVPAKSTVLRVDDLHLHTVLAGPEDGPLAVLLHGFPECWYSWRHQIAALAGAGYRVAAPDQRGYNLSDKPRGVASYRIDRITADIVGLIHAMGHEQATLVSHDWGGVAAWRFAMDYPQIVDRLVVMNAPHPVAFARELRNNRSQQLKSWYVAAFQLPWLPETLLALSPRASAHLFFRRTAVRPDAFSDADLEVMAAALAQPGAMAAMIHWYRAALRHPAVRRTQVTDCPTLLIWAEDDVALGLELTHGLARWVPDLRIHTIPGCGHWVQNEAPREVNTQLLTFLAETG
jgi:pimeloyl-ACP methyl ester carboxylesterase